MSTECKVTSTVMRRSLLMAALMTVLPWAAQAQNAPASASSAMPMDMGSMPGMVMPAASSSTPSVPVAAPVKKVPNKKRKSRPSAPVSTAAIPTSATQSSSAQTMQMPPASSAQMHADMPGMDHSDMPPMDHAAGHSAAVTPVMTTGPMQGGSPSSNARSPDYSDGIGYGTMQGMDMSDNAPLGMLLVDQLEAFHGRDMNGQSWDIEGWYGNDQNKLWVRTEGESSRGTLEEGDIEAFWNRNVSAFWSTQLGVRHDIGTGTQRDWAAFGIQGLAPYWFELEATGYVDPSGRTSARLRAEYELLFTQRLILQPEAEINLYGKNDPAQRIGSGLSDVQFGLRLRYEFNRQFAPYIGVNWVRRFGQTADYVRQDGHPVFDQQIVAGVRFWF